MSSPVSRGEGKLLHRKCNVGSNPEIRIFIVIVAAPVVAGVVAMANGGGVDDLVF